MKIITPNFVKGLWGSSKGMLGMVEAPGKYDKKLSIKRDLVKDISDLKNIYKAKTLISFLEESEMQRI